MHYYDDRYRVHRGFHTTVSLNFVFIEYNIVHVHFTWRIRGNQNLLDALKGAYAWKILRVCFFYFLFAKGFRASVSGCGKNTTSKRPTGYRVAIIFARHPSTAWFREPKNKSQTYTKHVIIKCMRYAIRHTRRCGEHENRDCITTCFVRVTVYITNVSVLKIELINNVTSMSPCRWLLQGWRVWARTLLLYPRLTNDDNITIVCKFNFVRYWSFNYEHISTSNETRHVVKHYIVKIMRFDKISQVNVRPRLTVQQNAYSAVHYAWRRYATFGNNGVPYNSKVHANTLFILGCYIYIAN